MASPSTDLARSLAAEEMELWTRPRQYARGFSYYAVILLFFYSTSYIIRRYIKHSLVPPKATAFIRSVAYRRPYPFLPIVGVCLIILSAWIFTVTWCFAERPYYSQVGPPPLSLRSGMLAVSMTPFVYALATKSNVISVLTGYGAEKLNVLHRWLGRLIFFLALVHTIAFVIQPVRRGGLPALKEMFYSHREVYTSGILAIAALLFLSFASIRPIRNRIYQLFKYSHIFAAVAYLAFMFWHTKQNLLYSRSYMWATVGVWLAGIFFRFVQTTLPVKAKLTLLSSNAFRVSMKQDKRKFSWKGGQYVYLRFPGVSLVHNHPFSIASAPNNAKDAFEITIRPYNGFTKKLYDMVQEKKMELSVIVTGPYGGLPRSLEIFDTVLFVAGGTGITAVMSDFVNLCENLREEGSTEDEKQRSQKDGKIVKLLWAVKEAETLNWFGDEIERAVNGSKNADFRAFVSSGNRNSSGTSSSSGSINCSVAAMSKEVFSQSANRIKMGRLQVQSVIEEIKNDGELKGKVAVIVSGPESLKNNVAKSVVDLQRRVGKDGLEEVWLWRESFGW